MTHHALVVAAVITALTAISLAADIPPQKTPFIPAGKVPVGAARDAATVTLDAQRARKPTELANVFSFGYAHPLPMDDATFEKLIVKVKAAGFNTMHCNYTPQRLAICNKHDIKMMADLLVIAAGQHIYKTPDTTQKLCESLRGAKGLWGYNIWNDNLTGDLWKGRIRDVRRVRAWDPTHPMFCGGYRNYAMLNVTNTDVIGWYDFHWKRGATLPYLRQYWQHAVKNNAYPYRWVWATSGPRYSRGNILRNKYTLNVSLAYGVKGFLWFLGQQMMDVKTLAWTRSGRDNAEVNKAITPLGPEIMRAGLPYAVWSTVTTTDRNGRPLPKPGIPAGCAAFPEDFWVQVTAGEVLVGVFKDPEKRDVLFIANHTATKDWDVTLKISKPLKKAELFDRAAAKWTPLKIEGGTVTFKLEMAGGELLRFE